MIFRCKFSKNLFYCSSSKSISRETLCPVTVGSTMPNLTLVHVGDEPSETMKKDSIGTLSGLLQMMCLVLSFFLFFFLECSLLKIH